MAKKVVLCVDDEPIILLSLKHSVRMELGEDYLVETASRAESALALIREFPSRNLTLAAVVSDWLMPGMGGEAFLRRVREVYPGAALMLLTGYADRQAVQAIDNELGLAAVFQKPCNTAILARTIREHVGS